MKKVQIINSEKISQVEFIENRKGQYRAIVKVQAGFMTVVDDIGIQNNWGKQQWNSAIDVFRGFKKGALQTIQFRAEGTDSWLTVFAKSGNKVKLMDYQLFKDMEVGDINQNWSNTNLYSQTNYALCKTKTWADKAFVVNKSK
jgi:hypothetical protein